MTAPYDQFRAEHTRLGVLQILSTRPDYTDHIHGLRAALDARGDRLSADQLRSALAWLDEQGLCSTAPGDLAVATLSMRGYDVASGRAICPGVARPLPA